MTLATVICCTLATVALIPVLRSAESGQNAPVGPPATADIVPAPQRQLELTREPVEADIFETIPLETDPFADVSAAVPIQESFEQNHHRATQVVSHSAPVAHAATASEVTDSHRYSIPTERSLYVPVTVHPVTVNVDGAAFADEVSRLAGSVDEMVELQRFALSQQEAVRENTTQDEAVQAQLRERDNQLAQIDLSLKHLTESVETLRAESRRADAELSGKLKQDQSTSRLISEFQQTLAEHRRLLERSAHRVAHTSRARFDTPTQNPHQEEVPEHHKAAIVPRTEPVSVPVVPEVAPLHLPAPVTDRPQVEKIARPADVHASWSRQAIRDESCAEPNRISSQISHTQQTMTTAETASTVSKPDVSHSVANVTPTDTGLFPPPILIPAADTVAARPAVFEQTVNFAMPPTTNPLSLVTQSETVTQTHNRQTTSQSTSPQQRHQPETETKSGPRWLPKLVYGLNFQQPRKKKRTSGHIKPGRNAGRSPKKISTHKDHTPRPVQQTQHSHRPAAAPTAAFNPAGVTVPDAYVRRNPPRQQHSQHRPHIHSRTQQRRTPAATIAGNSVQSLKKLGGQVKTRTTSFFARLRPKPQQQMPSQMHPHHRRMHAAHQPPAAPRVGSTIRHAGHTQNVR